VPPPLQLSPIIWDNKSVALIRISLELSKNYYRVKKLAAIRCDELLTAVGAWQEEENIYYFQKQRQIQPHTFSIANKFFCVHRVHLGLSLTLDLSN
jgi:hypothetical protein